MRLVRRTEFTAGAARLGRRSTSQREVRPLLTPIGLDPAHPFPQVVNKSLNFVVELSGTDAFGRETAIAIVKAPRVLPRVIRLPARGRRRRPRVRDALVGDPRAPRTSCSRAATSSTTRSSA